MAIYVKLLSGEVHEYPYCAFVLQLLFSLSKNLHTSHLNIKLFHNGVRVFSSEYALDEAVYDAFIEEAEIIDSLTVRVVDGDLILERSTSPRVFANSFVICASEQEFTPAVIESLRLEVWEETGENTRDLSLSDLVKEYVSKVRKLNVTRVIF